MTERGWFIGDVRRADGAEPKLSDLAEDMEVWDGKVWRNLGEAMREEFNVQLNVAGVEP